MANQKLKIGIIGVGMVGAPLMRYFEEVRGYRRRHELFLYDIDPKKGYFDDINKAHVVFVCVPTPRSHNGVANISAVESALRSITGPRIVIVKSTVPPGTTASLQKKYSKLRLLFNPEFLTERRAWEDMISPDRQIVAHTASSKLHASEVLDLLPTAYFSSPGTLGTYTFTRINTTEAELGKYAGNVFGAMKVVFGNVIKDFCESLARGLAKMGVRTEVEYDHVRAMLTHDRRIGGAWLDIEHGGYRGYGGYCFTKDMDALIARGEELLKNLPKKSYEHKRLAKGVAVLAAARDYNETLLETQGLTPEDVSVHDNEWVQKKLKT